MNILTSTYQSDTIYRITMFKHFKRIINTLPDDIIINIGNYYLLGDCVMLNRYFF